MACSFTATVVQSADCHSPPIPCPALPKLQKMQTSFEPHDELMEQPQQFRFASVRAVVKRLACLRFPITKTTRVTSLPVSVPELSNAACGMSKSKRSCLTLPTFKSSSTGSTVRGTDTTIEHIQYRQSRMNCVHHLVRIFCPVKPDPETYHEPHDLTTEEHITHQAQGEDEYSDDGEPNGDDENDRRDFKTVRSIPCAALEDLVLKSVYMGDGLNPRTCRITHRKEGSFHHCVFLNIEPSDLPGQQYVLKIPAHGTAAYWHPGDAFMLRNEAVLMQHIRHHTKCPVPEVVAFDETLDNCIGAPYILMKKIEGMSALDMWQGKMLMKPPVDGEEYMQADNPRTVLEELRINLLKSLAHATSQLRTLEFTEIGVPVFERPEDDQPVTYGPVWNWHSKSYMQELTPVGPFKTSRAFFETGLDNALNMGDIEGYDQNDTVTLALKGARKLLEISIDSVPLAASSMLPPFQCVDDEQAQKPDSPTTHFVLRHEDLDLQNILVDEDGNVTGIIDWDGCMTVPSCIGYASIPTFLRRDWLPDHTMANRPYLTWATKRYRDIYAEAMVEALHIDHSDAMYIKKSAMYQALLAVLYDDDNCFGVLGKILAEIEEFRRVDMKELCIRLGKGWPAAEKVLTEKVAELLAPSP